MGAADADDHTADEDDRADVCPSPVWATSFYGIAGSSRPRASRGGRGERREPKAATRDSGSTPALMAAEEGHTERLAAGAGAIGQGGLRQGHDERRRNACFRTGLERVHGLDAGGGACFWQSRAGTARASSTQLQVLE